MFDVPSRIATLLKAHVVEILIIDILQSYDSDGSLLQGLQVLVLQLKRLQAQQVTVCYKVCL